MSPIIYRSLQSRILLIAYLLWARPSTRLFFFPYYLIMYLQQIFEVSVNVHFTGEELKAHRGKNPPQDYTF